MELFRLQVFFIDFPITRLEYLTIFVPTPNTPPPTNTPPPPTNTPPTPTTTTPTPPTKSPLIISIESVISDGEEWLDKIENKEITEIPGSTIYSYYTRVADEINRIDKNCDTIFSLRLLEINRLNREPNRFDFPEESRLKVILQYHENFLSQQIELLKTIKSEVLLKENQEKCLTK